MTLSSSPLTTNSRNKFSFFVAGKAIPQGSMVSRGKFVVAANAKPLYSWRQEIASQCLKHRPAGWDITQPISLHLVFVFPRPKSHFRTAKGCHTQLKPSAPQHHLVAPDNDKLVRAVGDAISITHAAIQNDSLIVSLYSLKRYARQSIPDNYDPCGTRVTIIPLDS